MIIDYGAFLNCISLKKIHFEKCIMPINTNIYNSNVPDDLLIIVNDKLYKLFLKTEIPANHSKLKLYSEYIHEKIFFLKNANIICSIIYIENFVLLNNIIEINQILKQLIDILKNKYNIFDKDINVVRFFLNKELELKNES